MGPSKNPRYGPLGHHTPAPWVPGHSASRYSNSFWLASRAHEPSKYFVVIRKGTPPPSPVRNSKVAFFYSVCSGIWHRDVVNTDKAVRLTPQNRPAPWVWRTGFCWGTVLRAVHSDADGYAQRAGGRGDNGIGLSISCLSDV